ncbi:MAG TPA: molybdenum cofactor guanylyltransferase, partial [Chloroflexia bacterium]|nr:molybdenum cofactor guanylyltransferase [Chloroflexia bacterium]
MTGETMNHGLGVAVLAGGASVRMGVDKALLRGRPGGPTMIEAVVARLRAAGLAPDLLVTNSPAIFSFLGIPMQPDEIRGVGPTGGIYTALSHLPCERVLVVGCDMPLLNPGLLRYMAELPYDADALVPRWTDAEGHLHVETLHAIYSRRCMEPVRRRIEAGRLKVRALLDEVSVRYLDDGEMRRHDPGLESFRNANTPEEWERLRDRL